MLEFTPEQIEAAMAAKSPEELLKMAKEHGIEVSEEQAKLFLSQAIIELSDKSWTMWQVGDQYVRFSTLAPSAKVQT